jgi:thioredoxin-like negative regulator of GroEL
MSRPFDSALETSLQRAERTYVKLCLGLIGVLCLLVIVCWGGHRFYVRWQEHKLMRQAHVAFDKNDLRWATMAAQRAYAVEPESADACRMLATVAERQDSPEAIDWRRRVVALNPNSMPDRIALVESALRFQQSAIAAGVLAQVPAEQQNDARYHGTAAHVALTKNDLTTAEQHLTMAVRLSPNDPQRQLELAEVQLRSDDRSKRDAGRALAERLKIDPRVRLDALHVLLDNAGRWRHDSASVELARELDRLPDAPFADRLAALGILRGLNDPDFTASLTRLEAESTRSAEKAVNLLTWMNSHGLSLLAIDWSKQLPPEMLGSIPLRFALADAYVRLRDWAALKAILQRGSWDGAEPIRRALQAKAAHESGDAVGFETNWVAAVGAAGADPANLNLLQTIAFQWNWSDKATAVLWMLAENPDAQRDALQALYRYYAAQRDTSGLYRTLSRLVGVIPQDPALRNNFAQISLLLKAETSHARAIAQDLHKANPHDAAFASTYAFALFQSGDVKGALKIMRQLTPEQLHDPSVAAYFGILLAAAGQNDNATEYFALAEKAKLLPEEEELVAQAKASLVRQ